MSAILKSRAPIKCDGVTCVACPRCSHPIDMTGCDRYPGHVTYWGDDGPVSDACPACDATIYLKEHVTRRWTVGTTAEEAHDA